MMGSFTDDVVERDEPRQTSPSAQQRWILQQLEGLKTHAETIGWKDPKRAGGGQRDDRARMKDEMDWDNVERQAVRMSHALVGPGGTDTAVMLTPGTDASADLGLALMAAHRSGARGPGRGGQVRDPLRGRHRERPWR